MRPAVTLNPLDGIYTTMEELRRLYSSLRLMTETDPRFRTDDPAALDRHARTLAATAIDDNLDLTEALTTACERLTEEEKAEVRRVAKETILPFYLESPIYERAHRKPRGYAGDYKLMTMYFGDRYEGSPFGRVLHALAHHYGLAKAVVGREVLTRGRIASRLSTGEPARIASIACGPALEMKNALRDVGSVSAPVEFILFDQDPEAIAYAEAGLRAVIDANPEGYAQVTVTPVTMSIKHLLKPHRPEHDRILQGLQGLDFVYASGLFDYLPQPVAQALVALLFGQLKPGGQLSIGNLRHQADTVWMMEYTVDWQLIYRTPEEMLAMAANLREVPAQCDVSADETGTCMFLDLVRA